MRSFILTVLVILPVSLTLGVAQEPPKGLKLPTRAEVMEAKLKQSQLIVAGIAKNDFRLIADAAEEMARISRAAEFLNAHKGQDYQIMIRMFQRNAEEIAAKAKAKNMDGVLVGFGEMTISCAKCHQYTRETKDSQ